MESGVRVGRRFLYRKKIALVVHRLPFVFGRGYACGEVVNCSIPRSGSTMLENFARQLLALRLLKSYVFVADERSYLGHRAKPRRLEVIKIHDYSEVIGRSIQRGVSLGIFSHRNLLDIAASMVQRGWVEPRVGDFAKGKLFEKTLNNARAYMRLENMHFFSYEDLLRNPADCVGALAGLLDVDASSKEIEAVVAGEYLRFPDASAVRGGEKVAKVTGKYIDHIQDPSPGKWRRVLADGIAEAVLSIGADYQDFFGYPSTLDEYRDVRG